MKPFQNSLKEQHNYRKFSFEYKGQSPKSKSSLLEFVLKILDNLLWNNMVASMKNYVHAKPASKQIINKLNREAKWWIP